jgi:hypothetical protein
MREAIVPVVNVLALFKSALRGEYPPGPILASLALTALAAAIALAVARRVGAREART